MRQRHNCRAINPSCCWIFLSEISSPLAPYKLDSCLTLLRFGISCKEAQILFAKAAAVSIAPLKLRFCTDSEYRDTDNNDGDEVCISEDKNMDANA
ncbi:hypothetical protein PsorP6_014507 [Peronosclerospora sorghi]|uniref:Uncharacterized protein n=1 Tax=Peronosclerospora sorghi TaxID=230839 RepID=A0ACC0VV98_9STRA|nr:hypothetical protein PsorP6_014507 [Peronosclerospora sorghi]